MMKYFKLTLAELGLLIFVIGLLVVIAIPNFLKCSTCAMVDNNLKEMNKVARAIEGFHAINESYPAWRFQPLNAMDTDRNTDILEMPSFVIATEDPSKYPTLTTPIAFLKRYPMDRFSVGYFANLNQNISYTSGTYAYWTPPDSSAGWIIWSRGTDLDFDITDPEILYDHDAASFLPIPVNLTYDPTNGNISGGDIVLTRGSCDPHRK